MTELLPCPFCGGEVEISTYSNEGWQIVCKNHDWPKIEWGQRNAGDLAADIGMYTWGLGEDAKAALIEAWNTRTPEQAIADELNAALESGTCEPKWTLQGETQTQEFWRCECGNCGECFGVETRESFPFKVTIDKVGVPNFCPNCGKAVKR